MKIYFRKTFKYDPCHSGLSKYESYESVTRQIFSPSITETNYSETFNIRTYSSSLRRCVETSKIISKSKIIKLDELREINFSLHDLVTKTEFETKGSSLVRERFIQSFVKDSLLENRKSIEDRVNKIKKIIYSNSEDKLFVSHSFIMKIIEASLKKGLDIFSNPSLISEVIFPEFKTYNFGEGFEI